MDSNSPPFGYLQFSVLHFSSLDSSITPFIAIPARGFLISCIKVATLSPMFERFSNGQSDIDANVSDLFTTVRINRSNREQAGSFEAVLRLVKNFSMPFA